MAIRIRIGKILGALVALPSSVAATAGHLSMTPSIPTAAVVIAGAVGGMLSLTIYAGGDPWPMAGALATLAGLAEVGRHMVAKDKAGPFMADIAARTLALAERRREVEAREAEVSEREAAVLRRAGEVEAMISSASQTALCRDAVVSLANYRRAKTAMTVRPLIRVAPIKVDDVIGGRRG